jgi:hypothetical protein
MHAIMRFLLVLCEHLDSLGHEQQFWLDLCLDLWLSIADG